MPDDRRLLLQPPDHLEVMVENLSEGFARENFGISVGLFDRLRVVRPSRRQRRVAGRPEDRSPTVPTARQQPEPVYEENRRRPGLVCALNLFVDGGKAGYGHQCLLSAGRRVRVAGNVSVIRASRSAVDTSCAFWCILVDEQPDVLRATGGAPGIGGAHPAPYSRTTGA